MLSRKSKYILYIAIFGLFTNCNKEKEEINVYYNTTKGDGLLWNLNDGIYTYSIGFTGNSKIKENKISEYNIVVDSLAVGDLVNKEKKTNKLPQASSAGNCSSWFHLSCLHSSCRQTGEWMRCPSGLESKRR